jgi:hypothetical protein
MQFTETIAVHSESYETHYTLLHQNAELFRMSMQVVSTLTTHCALKELETRTTRCGAELLSPSGRLRRHGVSKW